MSGAGKSACAIKAGSELTLPIPDPYNMPPSNINGTDSPPAMAAEISDTGQPRSA
jgi:hypothetical protein